MARGPASSLGLALTGGGLGGQVNGPGMAWFRQDPHFESLRDFPAYIALLRPKG